METTLIQTRVDTSLKNDVSRLFNDLGLDISTAIKIFFKKYTEEDPGYSGVIVVDDTTGRSKAIAYTDMYESEIDYQTYTEQTTGYDKDSSKIIPTVQTPVSNEGFRPKSTGKYRGGVGQEEKTVRERSGARPTSFVSPKSDRRVKMSKFKLRQAFTCMDFVLWMDLSPIMRGQRIAI